MSEEVIKTFVVIDLETNGFPSEQYNKCSITEISLYAFSAKCLTEKEQNKSFLRNAPGEEQGFYPLPPKLPRVLNKMTLMINPRSMINPTAEETTGLNNDMLENESPFDENTANCLNLFLERLEQPVCMVAHNGWGFDYPIIRHVYEKLEMTLPSSIYCIDSFKAFRELEEKSAEIEKNKKLFAMLEADENDIKKIETLQSVESKVSNATSIEDPLEQNSKIDWKRNNETTPQRKENIVQTDDKISTKTRMHLNKRSVSLSVRRSLFTDVFKPKTKYPPRGVYKLGNFYKRYFNQEAINLHRAESDVSILTKLILHFGLDFLAYAEERKQPFSKVPKLGSST